MDNKIITDDFAAHLALVHADAVAKTAEAKKLTETVRTRALKAFNIVGRLNALGAERVVQIGEPDEVWGVQMFVIDEKNHGTLLTFGSNDYASGFSRLRLYNARTGAKTDPMEVGVALGLRSWALDDYFCGISDEMIQISRALGADEWAWIDDPGVPRLQKLAPALKIEIKRPSFLRIAGLTPREWWINGNADHLRAKK